MTVASLLVAAVLDNWVEATTRVGEVTCRDVEARPPLAKAVWVGENVRCVAVAVGVTVIVDVGG